jgi:hypothetical protein
LSYAAYVLRVLSEQTLEINKEVKDPSVPGPSLAKEVKDSSLTILFNYRFGFYSGRRVRAQIWRFSAERAHYGGENNSIWPRKDRSEAKVIPRRVFYNTLAPFLISLGGL